MPEPETATVAPVVKCVPVNVIVAEELTGALVGVIEVSVMAAVVTLKLTGDDVPEPVATVRLRAPAAAIGSITNCAVICVALTTFTELTVTPVPDALTVAFGGNPVPVSVIGIVAPVAPVAGATPETANDAPFTVKVTGELTPTPMVTERLCAPASALAEMFRLAVIFVGLTTTRLLVVTPAPEIVKFAPVAKPVPVTVTGTVEL